MGQYYAPVSIDTMQYLYSHDFDNGLKLMEHSYIGNSLMEAAERLLSPNGAWHRTHLVWAGDYMDEGLFLPEGVTMEDDDDGEPFVPTLYTYVRENGKNPVGTSVDYNEPYDIRKAKAKEASEKFLKTLPEAGKILVNWTKGEYLDLENEKPFEIHNGVFWTIHPLSILTCSGNGRGGGDFRGTLKDKDGFSIVGSWAGDEISMEHEPPEGLELLEPLNIQE